MLVEIIRQMVISFLLQQTLDYLNGDISKIKKDCEDWIKDNIGSPFVEKIALNAFSSAWDSIIREVKRQVKDNGQPFAENEITPEFLQSMEPHLTDYEQIV